MNLKKTAVAHRVTSSNHGIFIINGNFNEKLDLINEIERELRVNNIMVTAKTCVISKLGCIFTIDLHTNESNAVAIANRTLEKFEFFGYEAQTVPKPKSINYFDSITIGQTVQPWKKVEQKPVKKSKSRNIPIPVPYSY